VKIDKTVFKDITDKAVNGPKEYFQIFGNVVAAIGNRTVSILSTEPGKPRYPIRWTSERQRRFVMAKLRRQGNLPYRRTGQYAQGWQWQSKTTQDGGLFTVFNPAQTARGEPLEQYVQGFRQQGFHKDTGWIPTQPTINQAQEEVELTLIVGWQDFMGEL
jgi:hypothetical protein